MNERELLERNSRTGVHAAYLGDHTALCRVLGRYMMYVDTRDVGFAPHMLMNGFWESWVTRAVYWFVKPGMHVADVGAMSGYYTLLMADRVGPEGRVYAFEPNPRQAGLLARSLEVNGFADRVELVEAAVGHMPGNVALRHSLTHPMNGSFLYTPAKRFEDEAIATTTVTGTSLDESIEGRLDFVKADVEGAELLVWRGMQRLWHENQQMHLCFEYVPKHSTPPDRLPWALEEGGAQIAVVDPNGDRSPFDVGAAAAGDPEAVYMLWAARDGAVEQSL